MDGQIEIEIKDTDNDETVRCTWEEFCDANADMGHEYLAEILDDAKTSGMAQLGGGAAPEICITILD